MDALTRTIDAAIQTKDYTSLARVFSDSSSSGDNSWQSVGQGEQRSLASHFIHAAVVANSTNGFLDDAFNSHHAAMMLQVFQRALQHLPATVPHGADNTLRQYIFDWMLEQDDPDYAEAARILGGMRMESSNSSTDSSSSSSENNNNHSSPYYKTAAEITNIYVQVAECFLAQGDEMVAESDAAVTRAGNAVQGIAQSDLSQHVGLILRYKTAVARVLDANRKFLPAAQRYHELSTWTSSNSSGGAAAAAAAAAALEFQVDPDDLLALLGRAATCAILAPPSGAGGGPQRARVLNHIHQDSRLSQLNSMPGFETHASILKKMARRQILQPHELVAFEASLAEHQKAIMGDGLTILQRGVVEHNMIAVSHLYSSIYLTELANILGVTPLRAEKIATTMILDGTILAGACLDQVEGLLEFVDEEYDFNQQQAAADWDRSITGFCLELNRVADAIKASNQGASSSKR
jgi:COP9 signalosome complex subunit 4